MINEALEFAHVCLEDSFLERIIMNFLNWLSSTWEESHFMESSGSNAQSQMDGKRSMFIKVFCASVAVPLDTSRGERTLSLQHFCLLCVCTGLFSVSMGYWGSPEWLEPLQEVGEVQTNQSEGNSCRLEGSWLPYMVQEPRTSGTSILWHQNWWRSKAKMIEACDNPLQKDQSSNEELPCQLLTS